MLAATGATVSTATAGSAPTSRQVAAFVDGFRSYETIHLTASLADAASLTEQAISVLREHLANSPYEVTLRRCESAGHRAAEAEHAVQTGFAAPAPAGTHRPRNVASREFRRHRRNVTRALHWSWRNAARADAPRYPRNLRRLLELLREREGPDPSANLFCGQTTRAGDRCKVKVIGPWPCHHHGGPDARTAQQWLLEDGLWGDVATVRRAIWRLERARVEALEASDGKNLTGNGIRLKGKVRLLSRAMRLAKRAEKQEAAAERRRRRVAQQRP